MSINNIKIYIKEKRKLLGIETSFDNYINREKKKSEYHGGDNNNEKNDIKIEELSVGRSDYIKNLELELDENYNYIGYLKISSNNGNVIEFGEKKGRPITILNFQGDNMIQYFFGNYDKFGINSLGFYFINKNTFYFQQIFPILELRFRLSHDEEFKQRYKKDYKELLKGKIDMIYLYRACILPDNMFSNIIKYC